MYIVIDEKVLKICANRPLRNIYTIGIAQSRLEL